MKRLFYISIYITSACIPKNDVTNTDLNWVTIPMEGHNVLMTSALKALTPNQKAFYQVDEGRLSDNPVVRGDMLTDYPDKRKPDEIDLYAFYQVPQGAAWIGNYDVIDVHFTRPKKATAQETCKGAIRRVKSALRQATDSWNTQLLKKEDAKKYRKLFFNMIGHTMHTLQDGFSPAHTRRDPKRVQQIVDICTYKFSKDEQAALGNPCVHKVFDRGDFVTWNEFAKPAIIMSQAYLELIYKFYAFPQEQSASFERLEPLLDSFLTHNDSPTGFHGTGAYSCEGIPAVPQH